MTSSLEWQPEGGTKGGHGAIPSALELTTGMACMACHQLAVPMWQPSSAAAYIHLQRHAAAIYSASYSTLSAVLMWQQQHSYLLFSGTAVAEDYHGSFHLQLTSCIQPLYDSSWRYMYVYGGVCGIFSSMAASNMTCISLNA